MKTKNNKFKEIIDVIRISNKADKYFFPFVIIRSLITASLPFVGIIYSALILDGFVDQLARADIMSYVYQMIIITAVLLLLQTVINFLCEQKNNLIGLRLNSEITKKTLELDFEQLESQEMKELIAQAQQGVLFTGGIGAFINSIGKAIEYVIAAVYSFSLIILLFVRSNIATDSTLIRIFNSPLIGIILVVMIIVSVLYNARIAHKINAMHFDTFQENVYVNRLFKYLLDAALDYKISKDIRLYELDKIMSDKIHEYSGNFTRCYRSIFYRSGWMNGRGSLMSNVVLYVAYALIGIKAILGLVSVGNVLLLVSAVTALNSAINRYVSNVSSIGMLTRHLKLYKQYLETDSKMYKGTLPVEKRSDGDYVFEFKNVSFHYPNNNQLILKNITKTIEAGKKLAIVGPNGAGKTTFIKLLCRLYDPTEGEILLNGINIKKYDYQEYIGIMSVVFQDFKLFSSTIKENVVADKEEEDNIVNGYLSEVGLNGRISELHDGIHTYLYNNFGEKGLEVSGGEAQKIAIARALYKDSPFVILDEPTSALDPISEYEIYVNFDSLVKDKTAVYISHRMSSCRFCDNIIVFENGHIIQSGNHQELLQNKNGLYHQMWSAQAKYYNV